MRTKMINADKIIKKFIIFVNEHDYFPGYREIDSNKELPSTYAIKKCFGSVNELYKSYFNTYEYHTTYFNYRSSEEWLELFKRKYIELNKPDKLGFDKMRGKYFPNSNTLLKMSGTDDWRKLIKKLHIKKVFLSDDDLVDAYKKFISIYSKFPDEIESQKNEELPSYKIIRTVTNMSVKEFRKKYFPELHTIDLSDYREDPDKYIEAFKKKYKSFGRYVGGKEYNKLKLSKEPSAYQLTVLTNSKGWIDMLEKLGLKEKIDDTVVLDEVVSTHKNNEQIQSIITKLDELIEEVKI